MNANERARAREVARASAATARRVAETNAPHEDGPDSAPPWARAIEALCDAVEALADVSEAQESGE